MSFIRKIKYENMDKLLTPIQIEFMKMLGIKLNNICRERDMNYDDTLKYPIYFAFIDPNIISDFFDKSEKNTMSILSNLHLIMNTPVDFDEYSEILVSLIAYELPPNGETLDDRLKCVCNMLNIVVPKIRIFAKYSRVDIKKVVQLLSCNENVLQSNDKVCNSIIERVLNSNVQNPREISYIDVLDMLLKFQIPDEKLNVMTYDKLIEHVINHYKFFFTWKWKFDVMVEVEQLIKELYGQKYEKICTILKENAPTEDRQTYVEKKIFGVCNFCGSDLGTGKFCKTTDTFEQMYRRIKYDFSFLKYYYHQPYHQYDGVK